jgi:hypothetical protein
LADLPVIQIQASEVYISLEAPSVCLSRQKQFLDAVLNYWGFLTEFANKKVGLSIIPERLRCGSG